MKISIKNTIAWRKMTILNKKDVNNFFHTQGENI